MTAIARNELHSYKQLPQIWYQIQTKFRDEPRPRSGLMRVRQFLMKDSYTFDMDAAGLDAAYRKHYDAYGRIFSRARVSGRGGGFGSDGRQPVARIYGEIRGRRGLGGDLRPMRLCGQSRKGPLERDAAGAARSVRRSDARSVPHARHQDHRPAHGVHRAPREFVPQKPGAGGRRPAGAGASARRPPDERDQVPAGRGR